jgi:DNA-binding SARP family transcriptional activator
VAADRTLRIQLLGGFRVSLGERAVPATEWRRSKAASVVKLLALAPGHRLHREQAMDVLWPDLAPAAAAANLRKALHYARRAIAADEGAGLIASVGESLSLPTERLGEFKQSLQRLSERGLRWAGECAHGSLRVGR